MQKFGEIEVLEHAQDVHDRGQGAHAARLADAAGVENMEHLADFILGSGRELMKVADQRRRVHGVDVVFGDVVGQTLTPWTEFHAVDDVVGCLNPFGVADAVPFDQLQGPAARADAQNVAVDELVTQRQPLHHREAQLAGHVAGVGVAGPFRPAGGEILIQLVVAGAHVQLDAALHRVGHRSIDGLPHNGIVAIHVAGGFHDLEVVGSRAVVVIGGAARRGQALACAPEAARAGRGVIGLDVGELLGDGGVGSHQLSALSFQHSALGTQHSALSTQSLNDLMSVWITAPPTVVMLVLSRTYSRASFIS